LTIVAIIAAIYSQNLLAANNTNLIQVEICVEDHRPTTLVLVANDRLEQITTGVLPIALDLIEWRKVIVFRAAGCKECPR
jgi:hypothetical protein